MSKIIYDIIKGYSEADILLPRGTIEELTEIIADELNISDYIKEFVLFLNPILVQVTMIITELFILIMIIYMNILIMYLNKI